jgi:hypothetical protein
LDTDFTTACSHLPKKDEGLLPLKISSAQKQFLDCLVSFRMNGATVQGEVNIDAADLRPITVGQKELRHPAPNENQALPVFSQEVHQAEIDAPPIAGPAGQLPPTS